MRIHPFKLLQTCTVIIVLLLSTASCSQNLQHEQKDDFTRFVNPFIGTGGVGHTVPGAAYPLGLIQVGPDTGIGTWDYCSGYQYSDTTLHGFSHTHLSGGGNADLGDVLMLPFSDKAVTDEIAAVFSKEKEQASPGYYSVFLTEDQIQVELAASERTAIHRYSFFGGSNRNVFIGIDRILWSYGAPTRGQTFDAELHIENNHQISGSYKSKARAYREVYFAVQFDQPFIDQYYPDESQRRKLVLRFGDNPDTIVARVSISTVSIENAWYNMQVENFGKSFEEILDNAVRQWDNYLSRIVVDGGTPEQNELFYTSLYHLFIQPNNIADINGNYRGADGKIHKSMNGTLYSTLALWDTYRTAHSLYSIIAPDKNVEFVNSLIKHYGEAGHLPVWAFWGRDSKVMIGNHAVPVIVDACLREMPGIDKEMAFAAINESLTKNHWSKYNWSIYDQYGYLPSDLVDSEAVSRTLEAAFDDWCAAQLAKHLVKQEDFEFFSNRAGFYRNLFDAETGFMRGKNSDGSWVQPFDPLEIFHSGTRKGDLK